MRSAREVEIQPEGAPAAAAAGSARETINSRYRVIQRLGRGGMGSVYLASDTRRGGQVVALKRVRGDRLDDKTLASLRNEFLSLSLLRHPNIAGVYDFGLESKSRDIFFTSEFVDGPDWLKAGRRLRLDQDEGLRAFLGLLVGVLRALEFIHCRGLVHLDLKPENVLIRTESEDVVAAGAESRSKVIDFGLAKPEKRFGGKRIMGTTYYIAPETILGARVDRRTDLYSLGVVLYQLATGELPFRGSSNFAVFKGHLEKAPRPPHELSARVPPALGRVILSLMEKKPADRYQNALEVIDELNCELGTEFSLETAETTAAYLDCARVAGREEELQKLHSLFSLATKTEAPGVDVDGVTKGLPIAIGLAGESEISVPRIPAGRLVILRGEAGLGKRRMVETLRRLAQTQGACALEIECEHPEDDRPLDWFSLARELLVYAGQQRKGASDEYARRAVELARLSQEGADGADGAVRELLERTARGLLDATRSSPLLLHLHDLHRAGPLVAGLLEQLVDALASDRVLGARILITATAADQADTEGTALHELYGSSLFRRSILELKIHRLEAEGVSRVISTALAETPIPDRFHRKVLEESDGNSEIVLDILSFLLREGVIRRSSMGWLLGGDFETRAVPGKVRSELKSRIGELPEPARRLGIAFAFLRDGAELALAASLADLDAEEAEAAVGLLKRQKLLHEVTEGDPRRAYAFVHSSAGDIFYDMVPAAERAREHDRAGTICEEFGAREGREDPRPLAHHYLRAGNVLKGARYGVEAAEAHVRDLEPLLAIRSYEEVFALVAAQGNDVPAKVRASLGALRYQSGEFAEAIETLEPLLERREPDFGPADAGRAGLWIARSHGALGRFDRAADLTHEVAGLLEEIDDRDLLAELLITCAELHASKGNLVESLRLAERLGRSRRDAPLAPELQGRLCLLLAENRYRLDDHEVAAVHGQDALRALDTRRDHPTPDVNLFCLARLYKYKGKLSKAVRQYELAAMLSRRLGAADRQARALLERGEIQRWLERPAEALKSLEQARELCARTGDVPLSVDVLCQLGETHRRAGEYEEARKCLGEAKRRADVLGNQRARTRALLSWAGLCLDSGDLLRAERYVERAERVGRRPESRVALEAIEIHFELCLQRGDYQAALDHAAKALVSAGRGEDRLATARLLMQRALLQCRLGKRIEARRALVMLLDIARSRSFPLCEGRARLLEGVILASEGKSSLAEKSFAHAAEIFRAEGSERDLVELYLEHGLLALATESSDDAYLRLEEGFYLAKKLDLNYLKCRYYLAMGLLEIATAESSLQKAEERLRFAEQLAGRVPYADILWRVEHWLARVAEWTGRTREAEERRARSQAGQRLATEKVPLTCRKSCLEEAAAERLEEILERRVCANLQEASHDTATRAG